MLNQILKFTLVSSLLLWLKPRWRGLLALVVSVVMIHVVHGEYLGYVELSGNQAWLLWSYALKWLALLFCILVYLYYTFGGVGQLLNRDVADDNGQRSTPRAPEVSAGEQSAGDDGFDFLRDKKTLESRAEKILGNDAGLSQQGTENKK
jgi:hypothetical protein